MDQEVVIALPILVLAAVVLVRLVLMVVPVLPLMVAVVYDLRLQAQQFLGLVVVAEVIDQETQTAAKRAEVADHYPDHHGPGQLTNSAAGVWWCR